VTLLVVGILGRGLVDVDTPITAADDLGLTRGDGCFEGLRISRVGTGVQVDKLDLHLARMARSAASLEIAFDEPAWRLLVDEAAHAWSSRFPTDTESALKLVLTRGRPDEPGTPTGFLTVSPLGPAIARQRRDGVAVVILDRGTAADAFATAPWLLGGVKTLSYVVNMAAQREAARRGAEEAFFVSSDGWLLESPMSSIVWSVDGTLHTVAPGPNGILGSTTLELLAARAADAGRLVVSGAGRVADLLAADAVLSVSSVRGPVRVTSLDGRPLSPTADADEVLAAVRELTGFPTAVDAVPA